jgi:hypothetical protein
MLTIDSTRNMNSQPCSFSVRLTFSAFPSFIIYFAISSCLFWKFIIIIIPLLKYLWKEHENEPAGPEAYVPKPRRQLRLLPANFVNIIVVSSSLKNLSFPCCRLFHPITREAINSSSHNSCANHSATMTETNRPRNSERRAMRNSAFSTVFVGMVVVVLSTSSFTLLRESRWSRNVMASLVIKFDDLEVISPIEKDLLATVTFSKLGLKETKRDKKKRKKTLRKEARKEKKAHTHHRKKKQDSTDNKVQRSTENRPKNATGNPSRSTTVDSKVSWLISFPNSGTTYTIHNTEQVSMHSTATNYAMELHYKDEILPVRPTEDNIANGPWQRNNTLPMPPMALTKTHCAGYSDRAALQNSIISAERFLNGCAGSSQYVDAQDRSNHTKLRSNYQHKDLVKSVIHLIRNPFDNVISRMHHGMKIRQKRIGFSDEITHKFMESPEGVMRWCAISDKAFWMEREVPKTITNANKLRLIPFDVDLLLKVPCHSEFFRYVEWHNAAIRMIEEEKLPSMVVYYEDYETNYNQTVDSILEFLDLSREAPPLPFKAGKTYRDLFFPEETQRATKHLLKAMASKELWAILRRYFP